MIVYTGIVLLVHTDNVLYLLLIVIMIMLCVLAGSCNSLCIAGFKEKPPLHVQASIPICVIALIIILVRWFV